LIVSLQAFFAKQSPLPLSFHPSHPVKSMTSNSPKSSEISPQKALEVLTKSEQVRIQRTQKDIEAIFRRDKTALEVIMILRQNSIQPQINIVIQRP